MKNLSELFAALRQPQHGRDAALTAVDACLSCGADLRDAELYRRLRVCPSCRFHYTVGARERIDALADKGTFHETNRSMISVDPIAFAAAYKKRLFDEERRTGLADAIVSGAARLNGREVALAVLDVRFLGGTIGSVVGEKLTMAMEGAARRRRPLVVVVASGGARMQEGPLALLQTAKIALARQRMAEAGMPFICVVTNPTLGAAYAGIAGHADFAIGEPGALVGYAAERSRATETEQTTEELLRHGLLDAVVDRERLRDLISQSLDVLTARTRVAAEGAPPPPPEHAHGTAWNAVQIARHAERPAALDYIGRMATTFVELRGDRSGLDDSAVTCGIAIVAGEAVVILAQRTTGGWIGAAGFRKAGRAVALATRFRLPIISLIDTAGADPSAAAGLGGLGPAMADLMGALAQAPVPVIAAVIGQGGSEAAAAFGIADRVLMLEHAIYTVIAPEQAAVLLHHDATRAAEVADALHLTADACHELKVVDTIVPEPAGGAHTDHDGAARNLRAAILRALAETQSVPPKRLLRTRYRRYRAIGEYHSYIGTTLTHEVSELRSAIAARAGAAASRLRHPRAGRSAPIEEPEALIP